MQADSILVTEFLHIITNGNITLCQCCNRTYSEVLVVINHKCLFWIHVCLFHNYISLFKVPTIKDFKRLNIQSLVTLHFCNTLMTVNMDCPWAVTSQQEITAWSPFLVTIKPMFLGVSVETLNGCTERNLKTGILFKMY